MAVLADCLHVIYSNTIAHIPCETLGAASAHHHDRCQGLPAVRLLADLLNTKDGAGEHHARRTIARKAR